jgi:tRNA(Arg) A34 adenosine deaminase TadA
VAIDGLSRFFLVAIEAARGTGLPDDLPAHLGAVIVRGGKVLSVGVNSRRQNEYVFFHGNHPDGTVHAEIDAVFKVRRKIDLDGCKMYVARVTKNGDIALAKPCEMCRQVLSRYGIRRVYFTVDEDHHDVMYIEPHEDSGKR